MVMDKADSSLYSYVGGEKLSENGDTLPDISDSEGMVWGLYSKFGSLLCEMAIARLDNSCVLEKGWISDGHQVFDETTRRDSACNVFDSKTQRQCLLPKSQFMSEKIQVGGTIWEGHVGREEDIIIDFGDIGFLQVMEDLIVGCHLAWIEPFVELFDERTQRKPSGLMRIRLGIEVIPWYLPRVGIQSGLFFLSKLEIVLENVIHRRGVVVWILGIRWCVEDDCSSGSVPELYFDETSKLCLWFEVSNNVEDCGKRGMRYSVVMTAVICHSRCAGECDVDMSDDCGVEITMGLNLDLFVPCPYSFEDRGLVTRPEIYQVRNDGCGNGIYNANWNVEKGIKATIMPDLINELRNRCVWNGRCKYQALVIKRNSDCYPVLEQEADLHKGEVSKIGTGENVQGAVVQERNRYIKMVGVVSQHVGTMQGADVGYVMISVIHYNGKWTSMVDDSQKGVPGGEFTRNVQMENWNGSVSKGQINRMVELNDSWWSVHGVCINWKVSGPVLTGLTLREHADALGHLLFGIV